MSTLKPSPRASAGLPAPPSRGKRTGDWIAFSVGDLVYDIADERHVGEVRMVASSVHVTVRWIETGWRSVIRANRLRRAQP